MKKFFFIYIPTFLIILILINDLLFNPKFTSDIILGMTAIVILWYTWETYNIRKAENLIAEANNEALTRAMRPVVGFAINMNRSYPLNTIFRIKNLSKYPVAVLIKCNFKINGELISDVWNAYDGKEYWNLQYKQVKYGHFCWFDLYNKIELFSKNNIKELKRNDPEEIRKKITEAIIFKYDFEEPPSFTMDLEVYSKNDLKQTVYYPQEHYVFDLNRFTWISVLTSEKPFWEYNSKPFWAK